MNKIFLYNPLRTYNRIKKHFKSLKGFFYFCKSYEIPLMFWNSKYYIWSSDILWKDKFDSPRFEESPCFLINLFGYSIGWIWKPIGNEDEYWEQALWYLYYSNEDMEKAKETWPWTWEGKSTWKDKYLK